MCLYFEDDISALLIHYNVYGVVDTPYNMFGKAAIDPVLGANIGKQILDEEFMYEMIAKEGKG